MSNEENHYFYGEPIFRDREHEYIENLLKKYKDEPATEELQKKIWDELQKEKAAGNLKIPFKVVIRKDKMEQRAPYIEVILDTKV